ncbi:hypothetical protein C8J56DRAFT_181359 [Mycena floridula]|nr:hypothetical protein C8J56DRAFT_181359 [Mycena floridula]
MGGANVYCAVCGGPPNSDDTEVEPDSDNDNRSFTQSDEQWLQTCVVVYADCISPPGSYDWSSYSVYGGPTDHSKPLKDPIQVPKWAADCQPGGSGCFCCHEDVVCAFMTHESCIRLAAEWSRALNPSRFESNNDHTDPSKFFWDANDQPVCSFFCNEELEAGSFDKDELALKAFHKKSKETYEKLGEPRTSFSLITERMSARFFFGYDEMPDWREGCEQDYCHEEEWGVTHLKRPDRFPDLHPLDSSSDLDPVSPLTDQGLPLDVVIRLFTEIDWNGSDILNLELVSRAWRDFFRSPVMQHHFWLKQIVSSRGEWTPTEADWTESAEKVREALKAANTVKMDWRRYYNEAGSSLNMQNRRRIRRAVLQLEDIMGYKV